jgi:biotin operon repressor
MLGETHAGEIAQVLERSRSRIKDAVDSLDRAGLIVGYQVGTVRRLSLNPRFVAANELSALLAKLALHDVDLQKRLATLRRRPRRAGKEIGLDVESN